VTGEVTGQVSGAPADTRALAKKAVRGAAWTIGAGLGSRVFGLVGTLLLTYFLDPSVIGEVSAASVLTLTASQFSTIGVGQYVIAKPQAGRDVAWHAVVIHVVSGAAAILATLLVGSSLAVVFRAPTMMLYLPGFVVQTLIDRLGFVPERLLA
jgi:lipopolysaccharide exporter